MNIDVKDGDERTTVSYDEETGLVTIVYDADWLHLQPGDTLRIDAEITVTG